MIYIIVVTLLVALIILIRTPLFKAFLFKLKTGLKDDGFMSYAFLYNEIFLKKEYDVVDINDGMTIFDVGANIGLFHMYYNQQGTDLKIYSFESLPDVAQCLDHNARLIDNNNQHIIINKGLGDKNEQVNIRYLKNVSALSSMHEFDKTKKDAHDDIYQKEGGLFKGVVKYWLEKQMDNAIEVKTEVTTLSTIIEEHQIEKIDLLKIDVEGYELNVLKGIKTDHFNIIDHIIIELEHFRANRKADIVNILEANNYVTKKFKGDENWPVLYARKIKGN